ncbi:UNVERIFIED_CONTAM: GET complex subunit get1 [Siphonaria sp. JEL0065]|nr:GET complex subunit get1 [Siphonaria sp. JEL0065]
MAYAVLLVFLFAVVATLLDSNYNALAAATHSLLRLVVPSKAAAKIQKVKMDLIDAKKAMNSISAQDEFAKWAKERRRHDKLETEYANLVKAQGSDKSSFERTVSWGVWIGVWVLHIGIILVYRKTPMFYVPTSFVGPFSRMLSMPFAPAGSVSVAFWLFASKNVIKKILTASKLIASSTVVAPTGSPATAGKTVKTE